jgi:hypothetical protein
MSGHKKSKVMTTKSGNLKTKVSYVADLQVKYRKIALSHR